MDIRVVHDHDADTWDEFLKRFPSSGPFHTRAWTDCFESERLTPLYLRLLSKDQPVGAIAGLAVDPRIPFLRSIDRKVSFFSGPALCKMDGLLIRDCMLSLNRYARDQGFTSLLSSGRDYPYIYDWGGSRVHLQTTEEYIVDLRGAWERVVARMRKSIPEQARKAERSGLTFHEQRGASMLPDLLRLVENTRLRRQRKSGTLFNPYYLPHLSRTPLARLSDSPIARFFAARKGEETLCLVLAAAFCGRAYAILIGTSEEGYRLRAPAFLWFNAIRALRASGVESLNLAGGGPQSGHVFVKLSLGAERQQCTGSVSPYLKGPARNLLFQSWRIVDNLMTPTVPVRDRRANSP